MLRISLLIFSFCTMLGCTTQQPKSTSQPIEDRIVDVLPTLGGEYQVASSALYFNDVTDAQQADAARFLNGAMTDSERPFLSDLLAEGPGQFSFTLTVPDRKEIFADYTGQKIPSLGLVFYPTTQDNQMADYEVPLNVIEGTKVVLPKMQRSAKAELPGSTRFPLVLFSHGFGAHAFYDVQFYRDLASHGFIVVSLFHGDLRFDDFAVMQGLRTLAFNQAVDQLRASAWAGHIDFQNVGVIGVSFGGSVAAVLAGGVMNEHHNDGLHLNKVKVNSMIGLVPALEYRGEARWDFSGLKVPLFLIMAERDQSVPLVPTINLLAKHPYAPVQIMMLRDEGHFVSDEKWQIAQRLTLTRLKADLLNNDEAKTALRNIESTKSFTESKLLLNSLNR